MIEPDKVFLERLGRGDDGAFEELFLRHYGRVCGVLYGLVGRRDEAEDLAQETFLQLYRHPPRLEGEARLLTWLCRVALNLGHNALRGERRERQRLDHLAVPSNLDPQDELLRAEEQARIHSALAQLPERQSKLLLLRYAGLSYAGVAAVLDIAPGSVGTLLARAGRAFVAAYKDAEQVAGVDPPERTKP